MVFVISVLLVKLCSHDAFMANTTPVMSKAYRDGGGIYNTWNNIRIKFDYRYFYESSSDRHLCRYENEIITIKGQRYTCQVEDVLAPEKRFAAIGTLRNIKSFVERFVKVIPVDQAFPIVNYSNETSFVDESAYGVDLHITVLARPEIYVDAVAAGFPTSIDTKYKRPLTGVLILNQLEIPYEIQKENSKENRYFYAILHQMFHIMGITPQLFRYYHPHNIDSPHNKNSCAFKKYNRDYTFLITPKAHIFALKHYGVENFAGDNGTCISGIEFEDAPGFQSHLESRVFMTDVMIASNYLDLNNMGQFYRLTDATLAVLEDTGNYICDYRMAQPLLWGNPKALNGKFIKDFAIGPPEEVFPPDYIGNYSSNFQSFTSFDYKYYGIYTNSREYPKKIECSGDQSQTQYCKAKRFYDPKNWGMINDQVLDYTPIVFVGEICEKGKALIPTNWGFNKDQPCGAYKCHGYESFDYSLVVKNNQIKNITCTKDNVGKQFDAEISFDRIAWCPDPERFCRTMELYDSHFTTDPFA